MRLITSYVYLDKVRLHAFHGAMEQETKVGGEFEVSLKAYRNVFYAARADDLEYTVNYAALLDVVKQEMSRPSRLLENVAWRIIESVFFDFPEVSKVEVDVKKINPPMSADTSGAGVVMMMKRDEMDERPYGRY